MMRILQLQRLMFVSFISFSVELLQMSFEVNAQFILLQFTLKMHQAPATAYHGSFKNFQMHDSSHRQ